MTTIKLLSPKDLPEAGLTAVAFEAWQNQTLSFLEQETVNYMFISGNYSTWAAKLSTHDGKRVVDLHAADPDKLIIEAKTGAAAEAEKPNERAQLLLKRNAQLSKCLQLIANMCQSSEQSDVMNSSTSIAWIWDYLRKNYNIETRGSHFLSVAAINPKSDQKPMVFYKQFRAGILNNLRKKNDIIVYKDGIRLQVDEVISPTFECTIMLWALEKIDARLPSKVQKDFGFRMEGNTTLIELQTVVFQAIPGMLEELDSTADARAVEVTELPHDAVLAAFGPRGGRGGRGNRSRGGGRGTFRSYRPPFNTKSGHSSNADSGKSCRVCKLAGKSDAVVRSHNIGNCFFFTKQDQEDLLASLSNVNLDTDMNTGVDSPYYDMAQ